MNEVRLQREVIALKPAVVLFHPRTCHEKTYRFYTIPYSVLSVATRLDRDLMDVYVLDDNVLRADDPGDLLEPLGDRIVLVGVSAMVGAQLTGGLRFLAAVKRVAPSATVVWGGPSATTLTDDLLAHELVDHVIRGEGQLGFAQMAGALLSGLDFAGVPGLISRTPEGDVIAQGDAPMAFGDLGGFGNVYDLIDVQDYFNDDVHIANRSVTYQSALGCKAGCAFCAEVGIWNRHPRAMPAEIVIKDISWLVDQGANGIKFYDAEFLFPGKERAIAISDGLREFGVRWGAAIHPANVARLSDAELDALAESGASRFLIGAETAVAAEQRLIRKKVDPDALLESAARCADRGIHICFTFVTGYPGSSRENVQTTLRFARKVLGVSDLHEVKVHLYLPYPGTPLFDTAVAAGFRRPSSLEEWADLDYYEKTTPWVPDGVEQEIRAFNLEAYPYFGADDEGPFV